MNPLESIDANLAIRLSLKATKGVEIVADDHGASVCPMLAHLRHLGPNIRNTCSDHNVSDELAMIVKRLP